MTTEAEVLATAIEQFQKPRGFTRDEFFLARNGDEHEADEPGEQVFATCAIGGVEQAIWKITGRAVPEDIRYQVARTTTASPPTSHRHIVLYTKVMRRLNRLTAELFPKVEADDGSPVRDIEALTLAGSKRTARKRTIKIFKKALEEAELA